MTNSICKDDLRKTMNAAMVKAGIAPHLIYAHDKTGFILSKENYQHLTRKERVEYDAAIDEYFSLTDTAQ